MLPAVWRVFRSSAVLLLIVGLAGCFRSDKPIIDKASAKFPFEELTLKTDTGETAILRKQGDAYIYLDTDKPADKQTDNRPILLHEAAPGLTIIQETGENGGSIYLFAKRDGADDKKVVMASVCRGLTPETLAKLGVEQEAQAGGFADCIIKDLASLTALSQTPDVWSTETKTLEIVSIK